MEAAIVVAVFVAIFLCFLPLILSEGNGEQRSTWRARRIAEHRMNSRLLRLNI